MQFVVVLCHASEFTFETFVNNFKDKDLDPKLPRSTKIKWLLHKKPCSYRKRMINWICALLVATTDSCVLVGRKRSFYCYFNVMYKAKGRAKQHEVLPGTWFLSCSKCSVTFSTKSSSFSMCRGGLLQTLELREERWLNQSLAVDDGFNLFVEVTNSSSYLKA